MRKKILALSVALSLLYSVSYIENCESIYEVSGDKDIPRVMFVNYIDSNEYELYDNGISL